MQATLLGVGIAIILALVAALAGPHFVDWTRYRTAFEAEASRLVGAPVRIAGSIDLRILPTPTLKLSEIALGADDAPQLAARELHLEASLGALVRGNVRASELRIVAPEVRLALGEDGRLAWLGAAVGFAPDRLAVERVAVENGRALLSDAASGTELALERLWFTGEMRSLIGPVKGEGGFTSAGERYGYRLSAGRVGEDGTLKLRLALDPGERPLTAEADGQLSLDARSPRFEGTLTLARLAGIAQPGGPGIATTPWRATSRATVTAGRALLEDIEYQYGPDERALKLAGTAEIRFGRSPRAEGILTARQVDLDHTLTLPEAVRSLPLAAARSLIEPFGSTYRPPFPVKLGIGIDTVTLAGGTLLGVRGDLKTAGEGWDLERFEFRAPGFAQVRLSGHVAIVPESVAFKGPIRIEATDPKAFVAWLDGRSGTAPTLTGALKVAGEMTVGSREIAMDRLRIEADRKSLEGRLAYAWAAGDRPARLDAELKAAELDVDGALAFVRTASAGSAFELPGEIALGLDIDRALLAGVEARSVNVKLKFDSAGLAIERARIGDLGKSAFALQGRVDGPLTSPRGRVTLDVDGQSLDAAATVLSRFAPEAGKRLKSIAPRVVPTKLRTALVFEPTPDKPDHNTVLLTLLGNAGSTRLRLSADATGDAATWRVSTLRLDGEIQSDDGAVLVALLGLDRAVAVDQRPGSFRLTANGSPTGDLAVGTRLAAGGLVVTANGTLREIAGAAPAAGLDVTWSAADASPLARAYATSILAPLPIAVRMRVDAADEIAIDNLVGTIGETAIRGTLKLSRDASRVDGRLEADAIDASHVIGAVAGTPRTDPRRQGWSSEPFGDGLFGKLAGRLAFRIARSALVPGIEVRRLGGVLRLADSEIALEDLQGQVDEGRLTGELVLARRDGLEGRGRLTLAGIDARRLLPEGARSAATGRASLEVQAQGSGLSPAALVGSLRGSGTLALTEGELAGLDPRAFEAVIQAVDKGLTIDSARLRQVVVTILDGGRLAVPRLEAAFTINGGHLRLGNTVVKGRGADLTLAGSLNLAEGSLDARLALAGPAGEDVAVRPELLVTLKGPVQAPKRSIDTAALSGWLMLRSIERQARQLEAIEKERRESIGSVPPAQAAAPPASAPPASPAPSAPPREAEKPRPPRAATVPPASEIERAPLPPPLEIAPVPNRRSRSHGPDGSVGAVPPTIFGRPLPFEPSVNPQR